MTGIAFTAPEDNSPSQVSEVCGVVHFFLINLPLLVSSMMESVISPEFLRQFYRLS